MCPTPETIWKDRTRRIVFSPNEDHAPTTMLSTTTTRATQVTVPEAPKATDVIGAAIIRQPKAYPVYDGEYREALDVLEEWLLSLENFQTVGRNGLHRYNNQDHSMLSAMYAARNILGENNDVWNVNVERSYHEEFEVKKDTGSPAMAAE